MKTIRAASKTLVASLALSIACLFAFGSANASAADFGRGNSGDHGRGNDNHGRDGHGNDNHGHDGGWNHDNHDHGHVGFSLGFGNFGWGGGYNGGYSRVWVDGYYENVLQRVVVVPERTERRFIGGYWRDVCVPAVYDNRYVQVWHAGYYR